MLQKKLVAIGLFGMSQAGVKRSATIKLMIPGNRMISHFGTPLVALFIEFQQDIDLFVYIPVAVPLIGSFPAFRQKLCRGLVGVCYQYRPRLHMGMRVVAAAVIQKVSSHQSSIPTPAIVGISCCMYAYDPSATRDAPLHFCVLLLIQNIPRRVEKNNS